MTDEERDRQRREQISRDLAALRNEPLADQSSVGRAKAAHATGERYFEIQLPVSAISGAAEFGQTYSSAKLHAREADILGQIEDIGWQLHHVSHVFVPTATESSSKWLQSGGRTATTGDIVGIYLFRRA